MRPAFLPSYNQASRCWLAASWRRKLTHAAGISYFLAVAESVHVFSHSQTSYTNYLKQTLIYRTSSEFILPGKLELWSSPLLVRCGETGQSLIFISMLFLFFSNCEINKEKGSWSWWWWWTNPLPSSSTTDFGHIFNAVIHWQFYPCLFLFCFFVFLPFSSP